jgi:polygalacturonase
MGYGGKTVNGLSSLGPKMGGKAHGGGVKIEKGMGKISQSQDDVLSGKETKMENNSMGSAKIISGGHSKGKFMSTPKYKSDAQRKAVHASKAEQGAGKYGKHMGPEKELVGKQKNLPEELKKKIEAAPGKYGHKKGPKKANYDKDMAEERIQIKNDKKKIFQDDKEKRESEGMKMYGKKHKK